MLIFSACSEKEQSASINYSWSDMADINDRLNRGKKYFFQHCSVCHIHSIQGDPHFKNKKYWLKVYNQDLSTTLSNIKKGYKGESGVMPINGGCYQCTDEQLLDALMYLFKKTEVLSKTLEHK